MTYFGYGHPAGAQHSEANVSQRRNKRLGRVLSEPQVGHKSIL